MANEEKIYECEVKKLFMRGGVKRWEWVISSVADAIRDGASEFRCKDCHSAVRLHGKHVAHGPAPHVVSGSDVFRRCPNPKRGLGMALGRPVEQAVFSFCAVLGGRNVGQQLEEPYGRLGQGPARPRQSMKSARLKGLKGTGDPAITS